MRMKSKKPRTRASLRRRLDILEAALPEPGGFRRPANDEEWLTVFQDLAKDGMFVREPDFPKAMAQYQAAVEEDKRRRSSEPSVPTPFPVRKERLNEAFFWLTEMLKRDREGKPGVSEEEFDALARWHEAHESRIWAGRHLITAADGRALTRAGIRYAFGKGPRTTGVTELMEQVRWLRSQSAS